MIGITLLLCVGYIKTGLGTDAARVRTVAKFNFKIRSIFIDLLYRRPVTMTEPDLESKSNLLHNRPTQSFSFRLETKW